MSEPATQSARSACLQMRNIRKRFGATIALDGVDLSVDAGEVLALVGENGAGKSTLMKILSGAIQLDDGEMLLNGAPYRPGNPLHARRAGVGMIYQELSLAPHLAVIENILLGVEPTMGPRFAPLLDRRAMRKQAADALAQLDRSDIPLDLPAGRLAIADQQLVEIARAVALGCRVLVLDEPTSSLGRADIERLFHLVRRLKSQGQAIIYISHFLEEVRTISDRFTVLRDGKSVGGGITADSRNDQIIAMMVGRKVDDLYTRSPRTPGEIVLRLEHLAGVTKPESATLELRKGEVLGIAGLVGAGRTELLRTIFGLQKVRSGEIRVAAHLGPASPARRWAQHVGIVCEDRKREGLALDLTIADNLTLSNLHPLVNPRTLDAATNTWVDRLGIRCRHPRQRVNDLSGGNQQKVAIARLLHHDVDLLLLDEPTRGIDVGAKATIYKTINELATRGRAVLMVSSYLPELLGACDRIAVMHKGVLGESVPVAQTDEHQIMLQATGASI